MKPSNSRFVACFAMWSVLAWVTSSCGMVPALERDDRRAAKLAPTGPGVDVTAHRTRPARHVLRVRVYADDAYRRQTLDWRAHAALQIADTNDALSDWFGARLEVTEFVEWSHDASPKDLRAVLRALRARDPAPDVDRVLALTGALPSYTNAQHQLGLAEILGQYLVVRAMNDHIEREAIHDAFELTSEEERDALYVARRRHKEATVLLHEVSHTLGGLHARDPGLLMSTNYTPKSRDFTPTNERAITRALELHTELSGSPHATWRDAALEAVSELARADASGDRDLRADARDAFTRRSPGDLTPAEASTLDTARGLLSRDRSAEAWSLLADLREVRPEHPVVALLTCATLERERIAGRPDDPALITWCERSHASSPTDIHTSYLLANAYARAKRPLDALTVATRHEQTLTRRPDSSATDWIVLTSVYVTLGAHSDAERTLALAGMHREAARIRTAITSRRDYYALTSDLDSELEVELWPLIEALEDALQDRDAAARSGALGAIDALAKGLPPALLATCRVDYARRAFKRAVKTCRAAVAAAPGSSNALYNLGIAQAARSDLERATTSLDAAVRLNPDIESYWGALASILGARKRRKDLQRLRVSYREHFGKSPTW